MDIQFQLTDFTSTDAIEEYVLKRFHAIKRRVDSRFHNSNVLLRSQVTARNAEGHAKEFQAELILKVPRSRTPYLVKKVHEDFRTAVSEAIHALETLLRRDSEKRERSRKTVGKSLKLVRKVKRNQADL